MYISIALDSRSASNSTVKPTTPLKIFAISELIFGNNE